MRAAERFRLLVPHLRPRRGRIVIAALAFVVKDSPLWVLPVITADVIDLLIARAAPVALLAPAVAGIAVVGVNVFANGVYVCYYFSTVRGLGARLRSELASRLQALTIGYHARSNSAVVQTKLVRDVENVELMLQQSFGPILNATSILVGASVVVAVRVPIFLIVFALTVPIAVVLIRWLRARTAGADERLRREIEAMSVSVSEMGALMPVTRAHGLERVAVGRVTSSAERVRSASYELDRINGRFSAISWASFQTLSLACLFGASLLALSGAVPVTAGDVVLVSSYFGLLTGTLVTALQLAPLITRGFESLASIDEVMSEDEIEDNEGKPAVERLTGGLRFDGVRLDYGAKTAIDDVTLTIQPGESVAFVGPSGSGKSTLLNLALGLLAPTSGRVLVDGMDLRDIDLRSYRRQVAVVPQEPVLFQGSIRENVAYGLEAVSDEELREALRLANASGFIDELPLGWDTVVGERGGRLSGGQRQRIAIARALVRDPRVLLLDEATSALDAESERAVREALDHLKEGRTTLIVAHRLSTIRSASRIAVLHSGRLVEVGSHEELLQRDGSYAALLRASAL